MRQKDPLRVADEELTAKIKGIQERALKRACQLAGELLSIHEFHGIIGGKNNSYVDSINSKFVDFNDFFARWIKGLTDTYSEEYNWVIKFYGEIKYDKASFRNVRYLQDDLIFEYVRIFLERNFIRNLRARTREKPDKELWQTWFGYALTYGILITPVRREGVWTNDVSEIRRANYNYWTLGHLLETGIIDDALDNPTKFNSIQELLDFYLSVLKRLSKSDYEKEIMDLYVGYIKQSGNPKEEPFLIPELRYEGKEPNHKHRLDFTILNSHTMELMGFEISPASSHVHVQGLKEKQQKVNIELSAKWEKEMDKRNEYFKKFGITTITFTDYRLKDIESCFKDIESFLKRRPENVSSLELEIQKLKSISKP
jgi:hypothetical protein